MKLYLYLLLLAALKCSACEPTNNEELRKDVENAFLSKSFSAIANKYGESQRVQVTLENEYDDDNPTVILEFKRISELSAWFFENYQFSAHMLVPSPAHCRGEACTYALPELTLHHGIYLLGFEARQLGRCVSLARLHIYLG